MSSEKLLNSGCSFLKNIKKDFSFLSPNISDIISPNTIYPIIYLDNAATSQKPQQVIQAIEKFYSYVSPVHRGIYSQAESATIQYEQARNLIANFLHAHASEITFTSGATEGINFVAQTWAKANLKSGDEIIITELEHHSNIVPWLELAKHTGVKIKWVPITKAGNLDYQAYKNLLSNKTKLVAVTSCSNALGVYIDLDFIINKARNFGAKILIDMAQSVGHQEINLSKLQPDFIVFSGHKIYGPTGIGVLYIARSIQEQVPPCQFGGGMIYSLNQECATFQKAPNKYEAGTPPIAQAIGLAQAIKYISQFSLKEINIYETSLVNYLISKLEQIPEVTILGPIQELKHSSHLLSFTVQNAHPHDIAAYLNQYNIAVRAGNHCAQPLFKALGVPSSVRVSFALYNTYSDIDILVEKLKNFITTYLH